MDTSFDIEKYILEIVKIKSNNNQACKFDEIHEYLEHKRENNSMREVKLQESEIYDIINKILKKDKIEVAQDPVSNELIYHFVKEELAGVFDKMEFMEKHIYKVLQQEGDMGCSIGELKTKVLTQNPDIQPNTVNNT